MICLHKFSYTPWLTRIHEFTNIMFSYFPFLYLLHSQATLVYLFFHKESLLLKMHLLGLHHMLAYIRIYSFIYCMHDAMCKCEFTFIDLLALWTHWPDHARAHIGFWEFSCIILFKFVVEYVCVCMHAFVHTCICYTHIHRHTHTNIKTHTYMWDVCKL
jgi:hypothetical protein